MQLGNSTFGLWLDSNLTVSYSGLSQLTHNSDLSDNPQTIGPIYLGSLNSNRKLQTASNPGTDTIDLQIVDILPIWEAATAYSVGDLVQPVVGNGRRYKCVTAGTTDASEPTWPTGAIGDTVVDGTVVWEFTSFKHEETEFRLATTSGGLPSAIPGGTLSLPATVLGGVANAQEIWIQVDNAVVDVGTNTGFPAVEINNADDLREFEV